MVAVPPFVVGKPVTGEHFIDRESELRRLWSLVMGLRSRASSNAALIGLRRTGKTSILENLIIMLEKERDILPVLISCYGVPSRSRLAKMLVDGAIRVYVEKTGDKAYLKRLTKIIKSGAKEVLQRVSEVRLYDFYVRLKNPAADENQLVEEALNYIETLAHEKSVFFVIMLDEFQEMLKWGQIFLKRLRTVMQAQKRVCYILAGSAPTVMRKLVLDRRSPFYRQLVEIPISKLDGDTVRRFVKERLIKAGLAPEDDAVELFVEYCDGYPDYVQRLGLEVYLQSSPGDRITREAVRLAYNNMLLSLTSEFEALLRELSPLEREVMIAVAIGKSRTSQIAREVRKPITNISKTLATLVSYGLLEKISEGQFRQADPVLADWLRNRFTTLAERLV